MHDLLERFRQLEPNRRKQRREKASPATPTELDAFEATSGLTLPEEVRTFFATCDVVITDAANFKTLSFSYASMINRAHAGDTSEPPGPALAWIHNPGVAEGRIHGSYFHHGWLPLAQDDRRNTRVVSLAPPEHGTPGQIVTLMSEWGRGPFFHAESLTDYLERVWASTVSRGLAEAGPPPGEDTDARRDLARAILDKDTAAGLAALEAGADPRWRDVDGMSLMTLAAMRGPADLVIAMAKACPDACGRQDANADGYYPLTFTEDARVLEALLAGGADPNVTWDKGRTAMHGAAGRGDLDAIRVLVAAGGDVHTTHRSSPAAEAAWAGHEDAVLLLLELGSSRVDTKVREHATNKGLQRVLDALV